MCAIQVHGFEQHLLRNPRRQEVPVLEGLLQIEALVLDELLWGVVVENFFLSDVHVASCARAHASAQQSAASRSACKVLFCVTLDILPTAAKRTDTIAKYYKLLFLGRKGVRVRLVLCRAGFRGGGGSGRLATGGGSSPWLLA